MVLEQLDIHMQRNELRFRHYTFIKFNSKWITELTVKCKIIKFLEYNNFLGEKSGLKLNIQKTKIMVSGPITSWQIDGETMETVRDFIFLGSKTTVDGDCSHEIKRRLLLGRKVMGNIDSILKSRDVTLPTKVHHNVHQKSIKNQIQNYVFSSSHDGCESWIIKKAEH